MLPVWTTISNSWTIFLILQLQIICIRGCGPPQVIEHTLPVEETSGVPGDTVVYKCNRSAGYYEIPGNSNTITCQSDNTWSTLSEFCARGCGVPEVLSYAVLITADREKDIFLPGTNVSYECRPGYRHVPRTRTSITCLDNYIWSTPSEFCTRKDCGNPGEAENGDFEANDGTLFGSRVTYKCNEGYRLTNRRNFRDCQADGTWSNIVPQCEVVICPAPVRPQNGMYSPEKDDYSYLDAVTFKCNKDFHVIGSSSASCTGDGTWTHDSPNCTVVSCSEPGAVQNGRKTSGFVGPYTLDSAVRYECDQNFVMKGSSLITCNVDSQWQPEIPKCLTVCDTPPNYRYATLKDNYTNIIYFDQTTVLYNCKPGYVRDPKELNQITCEGRFWSTPAQFCTLISCGDPGEVANAFKSSSEFTFGSTVRYTCRDKYRMTSSISSRICQADGTWSPGDIICSVITCGDPPEVTNAYRSSSEFNVGSTISYTCQEGYEMTSSISSRICQADGTWSPGDIICSDSHSGLSPGALAGIIIGSIVALIAIVVILRWWCCAKKKSGKSKSETPDVQYTACNNA